MEATTEVSFNGEKVCIQKGNSLADVLGDKNVLNRKGIAVAVNDHVVPRGRWKETILQSSDRILIVTATQGG